MRQESPGEVQRRLYDQFTSLTTDNGNSGAELDLETRSFESRILSTFNSHTVRCSLAILDYDSGKKVLPVEFQHVIRI